MRLQLLPQPSEQMGGPKTLLHKKPAATHHLAGTVSDRSRGIQSFGPTVLHK